VTLKVEGNSNSETNQYINRLSDLLFILSRSASMRKGETEVYWQSKYSRLKNPEL
jgi:cob(I)alamin adenosyltransferase